MQNSYNNAGGFDLFGSPPKSDFGSGTSTTPSKSTFDWAGLGTSVLTVGGGIYASENQRKAAQKQADALIASGLSQIEVQKLILEGKRLDLEAAKAGAGASTGAGNKTLIIALGVGGVVVLALVIFVVTRKKA